MTIIYCSIITTHNLFITGHKKTRDFRTTPTLLVPLRKTCSQQAITVWIKTSNWTRSHTTQIELNSPPNQAYYACHEFPQISCSFQAETSKPQIHKGVNFLCFQAAISTAHATSQAPSSVGQLSSVAHALQSPRVDTLIEIEGRCQCYTLVFCSAALPLLLGCAGSPWSVLPGRLHPSACLHATWGHYTCFRSIKGGPLCHVFPMQYMSFSICAPVIPTTQLQVWKTTRPAWRVQGGPALLSAAAGAPNPPVTAVGMCVSERRLKQYVKLIKCLHSAWPRHEANP